MFACYLHSNHNTLPFNNKNRIGSLELGCHGKAYSSLWHVLYENVSLTSRTVLLKTGRENERYVRRYCTDRVVGQKSCIVVQNEPSVLPSFYNIRPFGKRSFHHHRHLGIILAPILRGLLYVRSQISQGNKKMGSGWDVGWGIRMGYILNGKLGPDGLSFGNTFRCVAHEMRNANCCKRCPKWGLCKSKNQ